MNLTLSRKIAAAFIACLLLVICASGFVYTSIASIKQYHGLQIERTRDSTIIAESNGLSTKIYGRYARVVMEKGEAGALDEWEQVKGEVFETMMLTAKVATNDELKKSSDIMQESLNAILKVVDEKTIPAIKSGDAKIVATADKEIGGFLKRYDEESTKVSATIAAQAAEAEGQFNAALKKIVYSLVGIMVALVIAIILLNIFLSRNIKGIINSLLGEVGKLKQAAVEGNLALRGNSNAITPEFRPIISGFNDSLDAILSPIEEAKRVLEYMGTNDFSSNMKGDYQGDHAVLKNAINSLLNSLNNAFSEVNNAVEKVNVGSQQVADASNSLSQGATESASSLEEITSSMNEIGSQTKKNAENSYQAKQLSDESKKSAESGNSQMKKMTVAIDGINESSQKIAKIIKVIDEIAFQTNLLALNAAVEAARAGKHGKGFAVVAEEVRNLAARSAQAAKETNDMIADSTTRVSNGVTIAQDTAKVLEEIYSSASKVTTLVGEISTASNDQAQSVTQIVTALTQIEQVTQRNTASSEESAAASKELSDQAVQLKNLVGQFRLKD